MRRIGTMYGSARRGRAAFAVAALLALLVAMFPSVAVADDAADRAADPTPAATATPEPTEGPTPASTDEPDPDATDAPTPDATDEPTAVPTASPLPEEAPVTISDEVSSIPTPENGDYVGSNTEDEADPGAYSESHPGFDPLSLQGFRAGNIISNAKMYTSGTMSAKQMQYFFDKKVPKCDSGYTCLKDFSMKTQSKSPNSYCSNSYQGASKDTAAQIISKVSKACGVSEKVLVVMLQKEQGLVTHTWPSQFRYDIAMGYACPDGAECDSTYFGFQNQMYMAAYQLQRYTKDSYFSWYPVGKTSQVRWHPNAACGSGAVHIQNKATAALYYYTPYQPNQAALNAGYGVGDKCSAYGNRNFYNYYTDWFGGTHGGEPAAPEDPKVPGAIGAKWKALGGASSSLGSPTSKQKCGLADGGCRQQFEGGIITWSKQTGAHPLQNRTLAKWRDLGGVAGKLSYPTTDLRCGLAGGGCYQQFEGGKTYWNGDTSDVKAIWGAAMKKYNRMGNENGRLAYPATDPVCGLAGGGCYQQFERGKLYWHGGTSAKAIWGASQAKYNRLGNENGRLGYPTTDPRCGLTDGGCYQQFQNGKLYWRGDGGANGVWWAGKAKYQHLGNENGRLGYPTTDPRCGLRGGGCYQQFEHGKLYWKKGGAAREIVYAAVDGYQRLDNENGVLGYPTSDRICGLVHDGCYQKFEGGNLYWQHHEPAYGIWGKAASTYGELGKERSRLGYPTSNPRCSDGTCRQTFRGGALSWERDSDAPARPAYFVPWA